MAIQNGIPSKLLAQQPTRYTIWTIVLRKLAAQTYLPKEVTDPSDPISKCSFKTLCIVSKICPPFPTFKNLSMHLLTSKTHVLFYCRTSLFYLGGRISNHCRKVVCTILPMVSLHSSSSNTTLLSSSSSSSRSSRSSRSNT